MIGVSVFFFTHPPVLWQAHPAGKKLKTGGRDAALLPAETTRKGAGERCCSTAPHHGEHIYIGYE